MSTEGFWGPERTSGRVVKQLKALRSAIEPWEAAFKKCQELQELAALLKSEDGELIPDLFKNTEALASETEKLEFKALLGGELDSSSAILSINAGAGGTESCDWVVMLFRMYTRFAERHGYDVKTMDTLFGEEAGIKNVTV